MITIEKIDDLILACAAENNKKFHPRRAAKINDLKQIKMSLQIGKEESWFRNQYDQVLREVQIIKKNAQQAIENMGDSIPAKERKKMYMESSGIRGKQKQLMYLKLVLDSKDKTKPSE